MTARNTFVTLVGFTTLLALGAVAWACTPSSYLFPVSPATGAAGTEVTIRGGQFGSGPVEIRWDSHNGQLLARAYGPDFSAKVTIPDRAEGVHYLVAVARDPSDSSKIIARRAEAFQVTGSRRAPQGANAASSWSETGPGATDKPGVGGLVLASIALAGTTGAAGLFALMALRRKRAAG